MKVLTVIATMMLAAVVVVACRYSDAEQTPTSTSAPSPAAEVHSSTREPAVHSPEATTPTPIISPATEPTLRHPQPVPWISSSLMEPSAFVSPSIDQQILDSDIVVVASFVSATAAVQTRPGKSGVAPTYRPMQVLRFRATEYLKGTGPNEFSVEVLDSSYAIETSGNLYEGYLTEAEAAAAATALVAQRNTDWDDRPGVLFLHGPLTSVAPSESGTSSGGETSSSTKTETGSSTGKTPTTSSATTTFGFVLSNGGVQTNFEYAVDTLSRTWLPARNAPTSGTRSTNGGTTKTTQSANTEYITDGTETPAPVISLSALRTHIGEIDAMLAAGVGIEGYRRCVYSNLVTERWWRASPERRVREIDVTIDSGLAAESVSLEKEMGDRFHDALSYQDDYHEVWNSGPDAEYFTTVITDDDDVASNGYQFDYSVARPLAEGRYNANFHVWMAIDAICGTKPTTEAEDPFGYSNWTLTVTAPGGTLHEAFFDPVTVGTAVKADSTNGVLKPTSFTVGGTATEITSLEGASNNVVLTLNPHVSLSGHVLDFIELDGSVSLSLFTDIATVDSTAGTYSWPVLTEPWEDGDKLMLRIREDFTPPTSPTP